jgi:hypothetical protein
MERNDPGTPSLALLGALLFYGLAFVEHRAGVLSTVAICLMTFATMFLLYGTIGLLSVWLEGRELKPEPRRTSAGRGALAVGLGLAGILVCLAGLFTRVILAELAGAPVDGAREGGLAGGMFFVIALLAVLYRRAFIPGEVLAEDARSEVPW